MIPELEELYQLIGKSVVKLVPDGWETIQIDVEIRQDVTAAKAFYTRIDDTDHHSLRIDYPTIKHFKALYTLMARLPQQEWKKARFVMRWDGHFDLNFEYVHPDGGTQ